MDLFFRVNVNEKIGFGHFRRITSLIENLPRRINYKIILDNKQQINKYNLPNMNYGFLYKDNKSFLSEREDAKLFCSLIKKKPIVLVLAWNFFNEIKKNNSELAKEFINIKSLEK